MTASAQGKPPTILASKAPNANLWWERSLVKRSTYVINDLVDAALEDSPFLRQHSLDEEATASTVDCSSTSISLSLASIGTASSASCKTPVVALQRHHVEVGNMLGKGSFSVVHEVKDLWPTSLCENEDDSRQDATVEEEDQRYTIVSTVSPSSLTMGDRQRLKDMAQQGRFAIKHLRPDLIKNPQHFQDAAADLIMEAKYLAALDHPNILKLRAIAQGGASAFQTTSGQYDALFLITDRLQGTLKDKILEWQCLEQDDSLLECYSFGLMGQPQPPRSIEENKDSPSQSSITSPMALASFYQKLYREKLDIAWQLASAMKYLHDRRLIYRDLKPQNVGLTSGNRVQLFDFGFCRELPPLSNSYPAPQTWGLVTSTEEDFTDEDQALYYMSGKGSLMYLAPEVLYNGKYNQKADCYSFAMVLYELLTLNKPFHSVANQEVFRELLCHHKARPPLEYSTIPGDVQDLLRHSWDDCVCERWTMRMICNRLQGIIRDEGAKDEQEVVPVVNSMAPSTSSLRSPTNTAALVSGITEASDATTKKGNSKLSSKPTGMVLCGAGNIVELWTEIAKDIKLGFRLLAGGRCNKTSNSTACSISPAPFHSSPIVSHAATQAPSCGDSWDMSATAQTEASSILSSSSSISIVLSKAASEDPLEMVLEQVSSNFAEPLEDERPQEEDARTPKQEQEDDSNQDEAHLDMEMRCPPSPLARTTSAPMLQENTNNSARRIIPEPHNISPRRQSYTGGKKICLESHQEDFWVPIPAAAPVTPV